MAASKNKDNSKPRPDFSEMNQRAIETADTRKWIAVLPLGAYEQHGPHLPFETDSLIVSGIVERLKAALPGKLPVTFLNIETVGYSPEHLDYEGSRSLAYDEAVNRWISVGEYLYSLGIRKLVLLNAHGGNSPLMTIVATELRVRFDMLCVATSWTRFGRPEGLIDEKDAAIDIHGGETETSIMLALHPEKVDMKKARKFSSEQTRLTKKNTYLSAYGRHAFGWKMQDLNPVGVTGNARAATKEKGEKLLNHAIKGLIQLLKEVDRFDLALFERDVK